MLGHSGTRLPYLSAFVSAGSAPTDRSPRLDSNRSDPHSGRLGSAPSASVPSDRTSSARAPRIGLLGSVPRLPSAWVPLSWTNAPTPHRRSACLSVPHAPPSPVLGPTRPQCSRSSTLGCALLSGVRPTPAFDRSVYSALCHSGTRLRSAVTLVVHAMSELMD